MRSIVHCLSGLQVASLIFGATALILLSLIGVAGVPSAQLSVARSTINGSGGVPTADGDWQAQIFLRLRCPMAPMQLSISSTLLGALWIRALSDCQVRARIASRRSASAQASTTFVFRRDQT